MTNLLRPSSTDAFEVWRALVTAVSVGFALIGDISFVAEVAIFTLFVLVNGAVIRLRQVRPDLARPFRMWPTIGPAPLPAVIGLAGAIGLAVFMDRTAFVVGLGALVLGIALSFVLIPRHEAPTDA